MADVDYGRLPVGLVQRVAAAGADLARKVALRRGLSNPGDEAELSALARLLRRGFEFPVAIARRVLADASDANLGSRELREALEAADAALAPGAGGGPWYFDSRWASMEPERHGPFGSRALALEAIDGLRLGTPPATCSPLNLWVNGPYTVPHGGGG